jgi:hypothetical protein
LIPGALQAVLEPALPGHEYMGGGAFRTARVGAFHAAWRGLGDGGPASLASATASLAALGTHQNVVVVMVGSFVFVLAFVLAWREGERRLSAAALFSYALVLVLGSIRQLRDRNILFVTLLFTFVLAAAISRGIRLRAGR